jgi:3-oxoacyl-[acyl-carrier-protein] synthase I
MRNVYVIADDIFSPLGAGTEQNMAQLKEGRSGIRLHQTPISKIPFHAALFGEDPVFTRVLGLSRFENLACASLKEALEKTSLEPADPKTVFILSSTKGNISLLESKPPLADPAAHTSLPESAGRIAGALGFSTKPLVVSHACISGLLAMITGMRLIQSGIYDQVAVTGADLITAFVLSGFQSFQAISSLPCRPFDARRDGITLGEAAGTVILSANPLPGQPNIRLSAGSVSNDANHISGPSRTGEELYLAIRKAMQQARLLAREIDFVSAHGTATRYNDEMEARAITLAGMESVPVNSLKGYYGHTLGAAGIIESIVSIHSLKENILFPTMGFQDPGTEMPINIIDSLRAGPLEKCVKTASGFGGCNAAIVLEKTDRNTR